MSKQKVTLRIEEGEVELLKVKFNTDNQSIKKKWGMKILFYTSTPDKYLKGSIFDIA